MNYMELNNIMELVKQERLIWTSGKLDANYGYTELMELGRIIYVHLVHDTLLEGQRKDASGGPEIYYYG